MLRVVPGADGEWWLSYGGTIVAGPYFSMQAAEAAKDEREKS